MVEERFARDGIGSVRLDAEHQVVELVWADDVGGDDYRELTERVLELIEETGASKLLVEASEQGLMDDADREWTAVDWEPRAEDAGLEYIAATYPADRAARSTVDAAARENTQTDVKTVYFENVEEARDWIRMK